MNGKTSKLLKTIHKYDIPVDTGGPIYIALPKDAQILKIGWQNGIKLWALVNPDNPLVEISLRVYGTGHEIDEENLTYMDTVTPANFVWHVFLRNPQLTVTDQDLLNIT